MSHVVRTATRRSRRLRLTGLAAAVATSAAVVVSAAPAHAVSLDCDMKRSGSYTLKAYCRNAGTTGTQFRVRVGCAVWSGGYEIYSRYGTWRNQSGGVWSSASCDVGHYVVTHGVAVR